MADYLAQIIAADGDDPALEAELLASIEDDGDSDVNIEELRVGGRALRLA